MNWTELKVERTRSHMLELVYNDEVKELFSLPLILHMIYILLILSCGKWKRKPQPYCWEQLIVEAHSWQLMNVDFFSLVINLSAHTHRHHSVVIYHSQRCSMFFFFFFYPGLIFKSPFYQLQLCFILTHQASLLEPPMEKCWCLTIIDENEMICGC